ncbi:MAG: 50S ribosomal protein L5 [Actinomycetota bacterium]|nr:50S ribosomal protein L5 [Actinomycetota bacterium]MDK1016283.1 50S ribosomal protein L5 [Actinomycetota bacterium]MDK1026039.1 50S ribosomal protein L5 [Actinomycetota bacterium]MDK1037849.1 50S ribosomal protein L5 [Actinomycetota bacterium]MDK1096866.1 50S ribosomal protein L5 [Actinomycetota bacterium]
MRERPLMAPRLKERYNDEIRDQIQKELGLENVMQVPRLSKIVVNMGAGDAAADAKLINGVVADLRVITGQQPRVNRARKSVSNFKIREGQPIGASVTLRGERMWEFFDRLIAITIPRIRDFRGLNPKGFDGRGNYSFGVTEQLVFPEIDYDNVMKIRGLDITLVTTAETDDQGMALLGAFGFPFRRPQVGV